MNPETYYKDHWTSIEEARLDKYEEMFEWHPRMAPLLDGAELAAGQHVLDFGCGPGGLAVELARRVAPHGRVYGVDLNATMVERASARAQREGVADRTEFTQLDADRLPFEQGTFDRVVCKSVLEYVACPAATLAEFVRVTAAGGKVHVVDSDWGMMVLEPLGPAVQRELFAAAAVAYRTPHIGRRLFGLFRAAGLSEVSVKILAAADTTGIRLAIAQNMLSYAREAGALTAQRLDEIESNLHGAVAEGTYLMVLPQFVVSGRVPARR